MAFRDWLPLKYKKRARQEQDRSDWLVPDDGDEETNKFAAALMADTLTPTIDISIENVGSISRWLLASLLTINSGAVITLVSNADKIDPAFFYTSLVCFLLGVTASFSIGLRSLTQANKALGLLGEMLGYFHVVKAHGIRDGGTEKVLNAKRLENERIVRMQTDIGKIGLAIFLLGAAAAAIGAKNYSTEPERNITPKARAGIPQN